MANSTDPHPEMAVTVRCDWSHGVALEEHRSGSTLKPCANCGVIVHHAPGSVQRTLTGRDALVMALGRTAVTKEATLEAWANSPQDDDALFIPYHNATLAYSAALAALSAFDASPETPDAT